MMKNIVLTISSNVRSFRSKLKNIDLINHIHITFYEQCSECNNEINIIKKVLKEHLNDGVLTIRIKDFKPTIVELKSKIESSDTIEFLYPSDCIYVRRFSELIYPFAGYEKCDTLLANWGYYTGGMDIFICNKDELSSLQKFLNKNKFTKNEEDLFDYLNTNPQLFLIRQAADGAIEFFSPHNHLKAILSVINSYM